MKISKKSTLIELLASVQIVCFTAALIIGVFWVRTNIQSIVRRQIIEDNRLFAAQMSNMIQRSDASTIEYGTDDWLELQTLIEEVSLPNNGYMCIAESEKGNLVCHPKLRSNPELLNSNVFSSTILVGGKESLIGERLEVNEGGDPNSFTGQIGGGNATEVVSVSTLPKLGGVLFVHQSEKGFRKAVNTLLIPIGGISILVGFGFIWVTKRVSVGVMNCYENRIAEINEGLEDTVRVRTRALTKTRDAVIFGLAKLSESRDNDTGEHLDRIRTYVTILSRHLSTIIAVDEQLIQDIGLASSLHDIGKVGVQDNVLLKPGRLTEEERRHIEIHPLVGQGCLESIESQLGEDNFLGLAREICAHHHEKWDGTGYPDKLAGAEIPLSARIVALADVYDALRSRRPYKDPMPHKMARKIILEGRAKHFDPDVVDAFLLGEREFEEFSEQHSQVQGEASTTLELSGAASCCLS